MEENKNIQLPHDGVVTKLSIQNLLDFAEMSPKPFGVLSKLEEMVTDKKIRKLERQEVILDHGNIIVFDLVGFEKTDERFGIDMYTVIYRYSSMS